MPRPSHPSGPDHPNNISYLTDLGGATKTFLQWSVERLNSAFGLEKVDQKPYNSSIKPMETMQ